MPITFATPSPYFPDLDAGIGALDQRAKDQQLANETLRTQASIAAQFQSGAREQQQLDQRPGLLAYQAQLEQQRDQQRAQQQIAVHGAELNQAEKIHMARLEQGIGWVEQKRATIGNEAADNLITQIRTGGYDALKLRVQQAQIRAQEEAANLHAQQAAQQTAILARNSELFSQSAADRTKKIPTPNGGTFIVHQGSDGHIHTHYEPPQKQQKDLEAEAQAKRDAEWNKDYHDVHALLGRKTKDGADHVPTHDEVLQFMRERDARRQAMTAGQTEGQPWAADQIKKGLVWTPDLGWHAPAGRPQGAPSAGAPVPQWAKDKPLSAIDAELKRRAEEANRP